MKVSSHCSLSNQIPGVSGDGSGQGERLGPLSTKTGEAGSALEEAGMGARGVGSVGFFQAWAEPIPPRRVPNSLSVQEWQAKGAPRVQLKLKSFCFPLQAYGFKCDLSPLLRLSFQNSRHCPVPRTESISRHRGPCLSAFLLWRLLREV